MFGGFALPVLVAIVVLPWFVVQDGPLHVYNAHLIRELLKPDSPFHEYLGLDRRPLPYWGGYTLLGALMTILPSRAADQALMALTSVGVATAVMVLRWRISGAQGAAILAPLAIVLSINVLWTYGLYSFLLGAILYCITLGWWWSVRDRMGGAHAAILAMLLVAGYFCHLVSFGGTLLAIFVLALATPGPNLRRRLTWTALGFLPSVPLMLAYLQLMGSSGDSVVLWRGIEDILSPTEWLGYVFAADFPTIHHQGALGSGSQSMDLLFSLPPPSRWALIGLALLAGGAFLYRSDDDRTFYRLHRGWVASSVVLLIGGAVGPSEVGAAQLSLRERVLLLGAATIFPVLRLKPTRALTRTAAVLVTLSAVFQLYFLWDYALATNRVVGEFMRAQPYVGTNRRVAAVVISERWRYRTNPLAAAPLLLGINSGNLIWNNHAPALFFFPVKYLRAEDSELSLRVTDRSHYDEALTGRNGEAARNHFAELMARSHGSIDVLVLWTRMPDLPVIARQWFDPEPLYRSERLLVLRHLSDST